jgi:hypothetical protein
MVPSASLENARVASSDGDRAAAIARIPGRAGDRDSSAEERGTLEHQGAAGEDLVRQVRISEPRNSDDDALADIAYVVAILIFLTGVWNQGTIVRVVIDPVPVDVVIAGVSNAVTVEILLQWIGVVRTAVARVRETVRIRVGIIITEEAHITGIADAVVVSISLIRVLVQRTVVRIVVLSVAIIVVVFTVW